MEYDKKYRRSCCSGGSGGGGTAPTNGRKIQFIHPMTMNRPPSFFSVILSWSLWSTLAYNPGVHGCALGIQGGKLACIEAANPADEVPSECYVKAAQGQRCVSVIGLNILFGSILILPFQQHPATIALRSHWC